jgi:myo-inositol-1(or 4)-monophosphatase
MADQLSFAVDCVREAGGRILRYFQTDMDVRHKSPNNPVTAADLDADAFLREAFARQYPLDGWLSEETADSPHRLSRSRVWVVDPIDGTKEFVAGIPEFAISIALVEDHRPVVAVVFNPAADDMVTAEAGQGARRNGLAVRVTGTRDLRGARFLVSRTEHASGSFDEAHSGPKVTPTGSIAWKLALAASGAADAVVSVRPKNEWDICAGILLIEEAGGIASDVLGAGLSFNHPRRTINGVIASNTLLRQSVLEWVSRLPACRASNP